MRVHYARTSAKLADDARAARGRLPGSRQEARSPTHRTCRPARYAGAAAQDAEPFRRSGWPHDADEHRKRRLRTARTSDSAREAAS